MISMISDSKFQFEMYVSQTDLAKLKPGQSARISLDAYSGESLSAHVIAVDPAATEQNGVSTYKVTLQFDGDDARVQAGLTGSVVITTSEKDGALSIPSSAVITRGNDRFVMKQDAGADRLVSVQTGIVSRDGMTEIISGITERDRVRTFGNQ